MKNTNNQIMSNAILTLSVLVILERAVRSRQMYKIRKQLLLAAMEATDVIRAYAKVVEQASYDQYFIDIIENYDN